MDQVGICNMALFRCGQTLIIQDINEQSQPALIAKIVWENVVLRVLEDFPWDFAMRYKNLALQNTPPSTMYQYRYAYPSDCATARFLQPQNPLIAASPPGYLSTPITIDLMRQYQDMFPFKVVEDEANGGRAIETNLQNAIMAYTAKIMEPTIWPAKMVNAVAWMLCTEFITPLSADQKYIKIAGDGYTQALLSAGADNMNEGGAERPMESKAERCFH